MNTQEQKVHFIGPFMKRYEEHIRIRAKLGRPIIFLGASGTGKRQAALIVADELNKKGLANVNCPGTSYELIMSDLFGHERGAFTDAWCEHIGKAERASKDSEVLYLDEIAEMDPDARAIFLNALQELKASRVGSSEAFSITCPIVATAMDESKIPDALLARFYKIYLPPLKLRYDYDGRNYTIDSLHLIRAILKNEIEGLKNQIELGVTHVETKMLDDICGSDMQDNIRGLNNFVIEDAINAKHGKASRYKWRFKDSPQQDGVETDHELIPFEELNSYTPEALKSVAPPLFFKRDVEIGKKELITGWPSFISGEAQDGRNKGISALILKREGIIPWAKGDDSFLYSQNISEVLKLLHDWLQQYRDKLVWGVPLPEVLKVCEMIVKYTWLYRGSKAYEESELRILNAVGPGAYNRFGIIYLTNPPLLWYICSREWRWV